MSVGKTLLDAYNEQVIADSKLMGSIKEKYHDKLFKEMESAQELIEKSYEEFLLRNAQSAVKQDLLTTDLTYLKEKPGPYDTYQYAVKMSFGSIDLRVLNEKELDYVKRIGQQRFYRKLLVSAAEEYFHFDDYVGSTIIDLIDKHLLSLPTLTQANSDFPLESTLYLNIRLPDLQTPLISAKRTSYIMFRNIEERLDIRVLFDSNSIHLIYGRK